MPPVRPRATPVAKPVHRALRCTLAVLLAVWASAPAWAQPARPAPCSAPEHRQFDFWLGDWAVHRPDGELAGHNRIQRAFGGCVLHEQYDTGRGYSGASFNIYDAGRKAWHQTWVDGGGLLLRLEGGLVDGRMVLAGETTAADGKRTRHRISWAPLPDGSVRQLWETSDAAGDWSAAIDGRYTRRGAAK